MNGQQLYQTLHGEVGLAFFQSPILHTWDIMIKGKILMAGIATFLSQFRQLTTDPFEQMS